MKIRITDKTKIEEIQSAFEREYPFLTIAFARAPKAAATPAANPVKLPGRAAVGIVSRVRTEGTVQISAERTVREVESDFLKTFGLYAEIFRKSGRVLIETNLTSDWSLFKQNQEGLQTS